MNSVLPRRAWSFLLLAYGISWSIVGIGVALGVNGTHRLWYVAMATASMFGPAIAAMVQQRLIDKAPWSGLGLRFTGMRWKYVGLTALVGALIIPLALLVTKVLGDGFGITAFGHVELSQERMFTTVRELAAAASAPGDQLSKLLGATHIPGFAILLLIQVVAIIAAFTFNLPAMMGEELGWRGYLYQTLAGWSGAKRVLFTGTVWGLWHSPLIAMGHNYPDYPVLGIFLMVVFCTLVAVLFDWSRTRSGSVWAPCVLHGIINGSAGGFVLFAWEGHPLVGSPVGVAGFMAIALLAVSVIAIDVSYRRVFLAVPSAVKQPPDTDR